MKVFFEPKVILVARPSIDWVGVAELMQEYGCDHLANGWKHEYHGISGDLLPELMGRLCYGSFGERQGRKDTKSYIDNIIDHGHGSVLEHATWSFVVVRCTRGFTHEMVRHRAGFAYSQESQHFVDYTDPKCKPRACLPGIAADDLNGLASMDSTLRSALATYRQVMSQIRADMAGREPAPGKLKKLALATARAALPNMLESKLGFSANARALRWFIELRGGEDNVPEIRMVAKQVADIMRTEAPHIFADARVFVAWDGFPKVTVERRKV